ncbi:hypothetical protein AVEN_191874-1 [Araneus ventricosus]|uniref:RNA-directed DNA polymerase n=1 Tax=Araneus ventricosus TaxID=182803 RepID=A0A4Y2L8Y2_ARAVE|nr:hypothetical protein AVEN_191874-1 [Araneus ventricosus]
MRQLANDKVGEEFLKTLWIQRLPKETQANVSVSDVSLDKLAQMADKIIDLSAPQVEETQKPDRGRENLSVFDLQAQVGSLTEQFGGTFCDTLTGKIRPFVPLTQRKEIFETLHGISHPGREATVKLIADRFVWPNIEVDCEKWTKACIPCQRSKIRAHTKSPINNIPVDNERFFHVHLDLIGPLPTSQNDTYCLTMIDRFTRWVEAEPLRNIEAVAVAQAFYRVWVSRFGTPGVITSD